jgi:hypothetical protein
MIMQRTESEQTPERSPAPRPAIERTATALPAVGGAHVSESLPGWSYRGVPQNRHLRSRRVDPIGTRVPSTLFRLAAAGRAVDRPLVTELYFG